MKRTISKKSYITYINFIDNPTNLKFNFNNSSYISNSYQHKLQPNSIILNSNDMTKKNSSSIENLFYGVDKKISLVKYAHEEKYGFEVDVNNHYKYKFIYSLPLVLDGIINKISSKSMTSESELMALSNMETNKNCLVTIVKYLFSIKNNENNEKNEKERTTKKEQIEIELLEYSLYLNDILSSLSSKKTLIEKRLSNKQRLIMNFQLLFCTGWISTYYLLIYKYFSWDVIEPTTFLAGNVLMILQMIFFLITKRKFELNVSYSQYFEIKEMENIMSQISYDKDFHIRVQSEIDECNKLIDMMKRI